MKAYYFSVALGAIVLTAACQKVDVEKPAETKRFEIAAEISSSSPDSKVTMGDDFSLTWDKVKGTEQLWTMSIRQDAGSSLEIVRIENEGKTAIFGFSNSGTNFEQKFNDALDFNAVYPYTYGMSNSNWMQSLKVGTSSYNAFLCDIEETQEIKSGDNMDKRFLYMVASADRATSSDPVPTLNFKNAVSLLSFTVKSDNITKMTISVNCNELPTAADSNYGNYMSYRNMIAGPAFVKYAANWVDETTYFGAFTQLPGCVHKPTYNFDHVNVVCENGAAFEIGKTYYIPVWPGVKTNLTATAYDNYGEVVKTKSVNGNFTCVRSKVHSLGSFGTVSNQ